MQITTQLLKDWSACHDGFTWFATKYPQGAGYSEVQTALRNEKLYDYSSWLTSNTFNSLFKNPERVAGLVEAEVKQTLDETKDSPNIASGNGSTAASSGDYSTAASSGYGSKAVAKGMQTVAMVAGANSAASAGVRGAFALAWKDGDQMRIAVGVVGENGIKPDTPYRISKTGELEEVS